METPAPGLQFDTAEPAGPSAAEAAKCAVCSARIADTYFEANGKVVCPGCKVQLEQAFTGGSRTARTVKAAVYGTLVAGLGAGVWYGIRAATGLEIGLISIVIGIGVGMAVNKGSGGRGGWFYQVMAMYLTYSAAVITYVPMIAKGFVENAQKDQAAATAPATPGPGAAKQQPLDVRPDLSEAPGEEAAARAAKEPRTANAEAAIAPAAGVEAPTGGQMLVGGLLFGAIVFAFAYAAPFLGGFENILGILIIAFGVWEAWRLNKKPVLVLNGPLKVGTAPPAAPPVTGNPADG